MPPYAASMGIFGNDSGELENRVRLLEDQVTQLWRIVQTQQGDDPVPTEGFEQPTWVQPDSDDPPWLPEVRQLVAANRKIEAIKQVREHTGWGLKEAKNYVDRL